MAQFMAFLLTILFICSFTSTMAAYNIADFGAKPDGRTDSAKPFLSAWAAACGSNSPATIIVPTGRFLLSQALFQGPCKNSNIRIFISGTIVAPSGYGSNTAWMAFNYVQGLSIFGGTLDGQGQSFWACKLAGRSCPKGATALSVAESNNILISGLTLMNGEFFHISIFVSSGVTIRGAKITAPENSPNTDGIHIRKSSFVTVGAASRPATTAFRWAKVPVISGSRISCVARVMASGKDHCSIDHVQMTPTNDYFANKLCSLTQHWKLRAYAAGRWCAEHNSEISGVHGDA